MAAPAVSGPGIQIAAALGARVIATASERNHDFLRSLGAEPVSYGEGLADRVRALRPDGVDVVADFVGGNLDATWLSCRGRPSRSIADSDVEEHGGTWMWVNPPAPAAGVADLVDRHNIRVEVARTFPLPEAADAFRLNMEVIRAQDCRHGRPRSVMRSGGRIRPPLFACCSGRRGSARNAGDNPLAVEVFELPAINGMVMGQIERGVVDAVQGAADGTAEAYADQGAVGHDQDAAAAELLGKGFQRRQPRRAAPSGFLRHGTVRDAQCVQFGAVLQASAGPKLRSVSSGTRRARPVPVPPR